MFKLNLRFTYNNKKNEQKALKFQNSSFKKSFKKRVLFNFPSLKGHKQQTNKELILRGGCLLLPLFN